jgi:hypothetical protein
MLDGGRVCSVGRAGAFFVFDLRIGPEELTHTGEGTDFARRSAIVVAGLVVLVTGGTELRRYCIAAAVDYRPRKQ